MKLGHRIFIGYFVIFCLGFSYPIYWMLDTLRLRYLEGAEEPLVDHAHLLAQQIGHQMEAGSFSTEELRRVFSETQSDDLNIQIYNVLKTRVDLNAYVADRKGILIFDSRTPSDVGEDYSDWRDVALTLRGEYGARTTREDPEDQDSSALYVAAPIRVKGEIIGSLTLIKPTASINSFIRLARPLIINTGAGSLAAAVLLSLLFSYWLTRPIERLTDYADGIRKDLRPPFPDLGNSEIADLGEALQRMQERLEGKQYVEEYVQNLTHEIKSPLSAIRGAAELLQEEMPPEQQKRFLENIRTEGARIGRIVDTMLELAALENRRLTPEMVPVDLLSLIQTILESKEPLLASRDLLLSADVPADLQVIGNSFLLHQAVANLVQNAIEFSPEGGEVQMTAFQQEGKVVIRVTDQGTGIPDYAQDRLFEKFYSLQRPDTGKKSTGLGLNFVQEVAAVHQGEVLLLNRSEGGVDARLVLPFESSED